MAYFKHRRTPTPYQSAFRQSPDGPVDDDGDRIYTEEDYAAPLPDAEDDAFLPDVEEPLAPYALPGPEALLPDPYEEDPGWEDEDADPLDEDLLTEAEQAELRRSRWHLIANLSDFAAVIVGTAVILILVALLVSLLNWLQADITQTFTLWQTKL